ncbi:MAG: indole-3-glycerol phosphate synthase TrpC [Rickettsiales bacterium]|nr:indole-3-glycerol phosphate synthase TrpC [Rickettsiales bacterium]
MADILAEICAAKQTHIATRKHALPESALQAQVKQAAAPRGFQHALQTRRDHGLFGLIAEIKKASPSGGLIRAEFHPATLAQAYAEGGAACLSILTDTPYFQGKDHYLTEARNAVSLPVLRKDFMLDSYQILESRALGADCILLIMAVLSDTQAAELYSTATELQMDTLVEVHDAAEMERALKLNAPMLGINNRNLKTLEIDLSTTETLAGMVPEDRLLVSESGIHTHQDLLRLRESGISCFLVGESLMRQEHLTAATRSLLIG